MKKGMWLLLICLLMFVSHSVFAQKKIDDHKIFVKTLPILKVMSHELGYIIRYLKVDLSINEFYIPYTWISGSGGLCEVSWGRDPSYPFFSIYYKEGKFSHLRLFLYDDMGHVSWGFNRKPYSETKDKFNVDSETFEIVF